MIKVELRAAAKKLDRLHSRYLHHFGRIEASDHSQTYLRGLLLCEGRKNVERMALRFTTPHADGSSVSQDDVLALQRFLTISPWEATDVQSEMQAQFAEEFVPSAQSWPVGTVGVIDESGFPKQGTHSVGVKRQWCGRLGKVENCQVGVFVLGVTPAGTALLEHQLFLPEEWANDAERRKETRVPDDIKFRTKPEIAADLLERIANNQHVTFDWIVADETYGRSGRLLDWLEQDSRPQRYVLEIPSNTVFGTKPPTGKTLDGSEKQARELAAELPEKAWQTFAVREGAKGPLAFRFARLRVWSTRHRRWGDPCWLIFQQSVEVGSEIRYWVSNGDEAVALEELALVISCRFRVEEFFEDAKSLLGMDHYEARSWTSWHHHMSLVALAHLYVTQVRREVKTEIPELTLDMAYQIVQAALARPTLGPDESLNIIEYHLKRNRTARKSHRKKWKQKHKNLKYKMLL